MSIIKSLFCGILLFLGTVSCDDECSTLDPTIIEYQSCCDPPKWSLTDVKRKCTNVTNFVCHSECILSGSKILVNGEMNLTNTKTFLDVELKYDPDYIPIVLKALEKCFGLVKLKRDDLKVIDGCSTLALEITTCLHEQIFINCPAKQWHASVNCEAAKNQLIKCPFHLY